jgi:predicted RND superfamily exporter protein
MLIIVLFITVIMVFLAQRLTLTMRTSDLLPEGDPRVIQFNKIIEEFATATNLVIVVQGEEEQIKAFADELAPKILTLRDSSLNKQNKLAIDKIQEKIRKIKANSGEDKKMEEYELQISQLKTRMDMPLFQRVDYKAEIEFMKNHLLMLIKAEDLENTKDVFMDPNLTGLITNLNNSMEKEYIGQEEAISTREKEDGAVVFLDGIENLICRMREVLGGGELTDREIRLAADKLLFGEPYMLSYDKTALVMIAIPNFSIMERDLLMIGTKAVQNLVDDQIKNFPNIRAGLSGPIAREHDETVYAEKTISYSTIVAFIFILILLMVAFRMWIAPIFAMLTLLAGVIWALGTSYIVVGHLNLLTAMMSIILLGLGIDFAIHFISGFTERRAAGDQIPIALQNTFLKNARGIITGASTTACAFLTLMIC